MPVTDTSVRQINIKNFRLSLAAGLVGTYNSRQRYALPQPIREACLSSVSPATKRARVDTGPSDSEGHFPIKGPRGRCVFCWNFRNHTRNDTYVRCRKCGKALCVTSRDRAENGPSCFERYTTDASSEAHLDRTQALQCDKTTLLVYINMFITN